MALIGIAPRHAMYDPLPAWSHLWNALHHEQCTGVTAWQRIYVKRCRGMADSGNLPMKYPHHGLPPEQHDELRALIVRARLMGKWDTEYPLPDFEI